MKIKVKGFKGSGKIQLCIPKHLYLKVPALFEMEIDINSIKEREKKE